MLTRRLFSLAVVIALPGMFIAVLPSPATAHHEQSCEQVWSTEESRFVNQCETIPHGDEHGDTTRTGGSSTCSYEGEEIPCAGPNDSTWNGRCYQGSALPEASQGPGPDGEEYPEEGRWHACYVAPGVDWVGSCLPSDDHGVCVWVPAGSPAAVNPVDVAWLAIAQMTLSPIEVGIVPKSGEDRFGLVGLPTWMWVADPDDSSWGPVTASASDGPVSVSATARARQVFWDMGDGNVVVCGKGVPYDPAFGIEESPNCGHRYERTSVDQPDQAYQVTATTQWVVEWSGGGMTGSIEFELVSDPYPVRVGEMQVLLQ